MFDLLLFAFVIWSLLEYRLDEREGRLYLAAFVYGAGMAENWAMVGFLPAVHCRDHLDSRAELFQSAFSRKDGACAVWRECCFICCCRWRWRFPAKCR